MKCPQQAVIITGGAGLLGRAFTESCAAAGYAVVLADIDKTTGEKCVDEIIGRTKNNRVSFQQCDITRTRDVLDLIEYCKRDYGGIYGLVNNAYPRNARYGRLFEEVTYEDFCGNVSLHLGGYFNISKLVSGEMMAQNSGNIVNMSSMYGFVAPRFDIYTGYEGNPRTMPVEYAAIKGGIIALTKYMASYLGKHNIRVNAISPGGVEDGQPQPFIKNYSDRVLLNRGMSHPDDITGVLLFLLGDQSKYITGQNIVVDAGWSI
jgi:NAD(P)-dependent dehydrogenase (short-subunit alcohol dehydrogenase family)